VEWESEESERVRRGSEGSMESEGVRKMRVGAWRKRKLT
jgi:hypothetical protein